MQEQPHNTNNNSSIEKQSNHQKSTKDKNESHKDKNEGDCLNELALEEVYIPKPHPKNRKKYKINTSRSRGELNLLKIICKENNWTEVWKEGDVLWSGLAVPEEEVSIATEIWVNRIPSMNHLCHKKTEGFILNKFREYWPKQFYFYPKTYLLPEDQSKLISKIKKGGIFIAKPSLGSQGDGIVLITKLSQIPKLGCNEWVVQPYIDKPLLLDGRKFDFRLYVLISSVDPYICYLNEEGLARFCTEDYQLPTKSNFKNSFMHLTNYSLNKNHPGYQNGTEAFSRGTKRCLRVLWQDLVSNGIDVNLLKQRITTIIQKYLIGIYPFLNYISKIERKVLSLLGLDILVDEKLNPWLLEANNNPSLNIEHEFMMPNTLETKKQVSPVDEYVKKIVVTDTLYLVNRPYQKQKAMQIGEHYYSFKKILDRESTEIKEMNLIENMLKLFHSQCSIREKAVLTASQFCKLAAFTGMTNARITKNDYHLIFIKIMRGKPNPNQMAFEDFIQALEYIVHEIVGYEKATKLAAMQSHTELLVGQL